jgi:hypothetical protein
MGPIYRVALQTLDPSPRLESLAGVAELADALVLGTSSSECGFESLRPHRFTPLSTLLNSSANVGISICRISR